MAASLNAESTTTSCNSTSASRISQTSNGNVNSESSGIASEDMMDLDELPEEATSGANPGLGAEEFDGDMASSASGTIPRLARTFPGASGGASAAQHRMTHSDTPSVSRTRKELRYIH